MTPLAPYSLLFRRENVRFLVFFISAGLFSAALIKPLLDAVTTDVVSRLLDELPIFTCILVLPPLGIGVHNS